VNITITPTAWSLNLDVPQAHLLAHSLGAIAHAYAAPPENLAPAVQAYFRGSITSAADIGELAQAQEDLELERAQWRSERLAKISRWRDQLRKGLELQHPRLLLVTEDVPVFLAVLNDRRLVLAAEGGVTEEIMNADPQELEDEDLQRKIWEIHLLAYFQEEILEKMDGEGP
jgi:hypothetical protein